MDKIETHQPKQIKRGDIKINMIVAYASQFTSKIICKIKTIEKPEGIVDDESFKNFEYDLYNPFNGERYGKVDGTYRLFKINSIAIKEKLTKEFVNKQYRDDIYS